MDWTGTDKGEKCICLININIDVYSVVGKGVNYVWCTGTDGYTDSVHMDIHGIVHMQLPLHP